MAKKWGRTRIESQLFLMTMAMIFPLRYRPARFKSFSNIFKEPPFGDLGGSVV